MLRSLSHGHRHHQSSLFSPTKTLLKKPRYPHMIGEVDFHYRQDFFDNNNTGGNSQQLEHLPSFDHPNQNPNTNNMNMLHHNGHQQQKYLYLPLSASTGGRFSSACEYMLIDVARNRGFKSQFWITANQLYRRFNGGQVLESERDKGVDVGLGRGPMSLVNLCDVEPSDAALFLRSFPLPQSCMTVFDSDFDKSGGVSVPIGSHRIFDGLKWNRYRGRELNAALDELLRKRYSSSSSSESNDDGEDNENENENGEDDFFSSRSSFSSPVPSGGTPNWIFYDVVESRKMLLKPNRGPRYAYECFDVKSFQQQQQQQLNHQNQHYNTHTDNNYSTMLMNNNNNNFSNQYHNEQQQDLWMMNASSVSSSPPNFQQQQMGNWNFGTANHQNGNNTLPVVASLWNGSTNNINNNDGYFHQNNNNNGSNFGNNNNNDGNRYYPPAPSLPPQSASLASSSMSCIFFNAEQTDRFDEIEGMWINFTLPEDVARGNWDNLFLNSSNKEKEGQHQAHVLGNTTSSANNGHHSKISHYFFNPSSSSWTSGASNTSSSSASPSASIASSSQQFWNQHQQHQASSPLPSLSIEDRNQVLGQQQQNQNSNPNQHQLQRQLNMNNNNNNNNNNNGGSSSYTDPYEVAQRQEENIVPLGNNNDDYQQHKPEAHHQLRTTMQQQQQQHQPQQQQQQQQRVESSSAATTTSSANEFLSGFSQMPSRAKLNEADFSWSGCFE